MLKRQAHNPKVVRSNLAPATTEKPWKHSFPRLFCTNSFLTAILNIPSGTYRIPLTCTEYALIWLVLYRDLRILFLDSSKECPYMFSDVGF